MKTVLLISLLVWSAMRVLLLVLVLAPVVVWASVVEGVVLDDLSGDALSSVLVRLSTVDGRALKEAETKRDGRFLFSGLVSGEYRLTLTKSNFIRIEVRLTSVDKTSVADAPPVTLRLLKYGLLSGRLLPPRTANVLLLEKVGPGEVSRIFSGAANTAGEYRIHGVPPGRYSVAATNLGGAGVQRGLVLYPSMRQPREFVFFGGEDYSGIDIVVPPERAFAVEGEMQQSGAKRSYSVSLVSDTIPSIRLATMLSSNGRFRFEGVLPGNYEIIASSLSVASSSVLFGRARFSVISEDIAALSVTPEAPRSVVITIQTAEELKQRCSSEGTAMFTPLESWSSTPGKSVPFVLGRPARIEGLAPAQHAVTVKSSRGNCVGSAALLSVDTPVQGVTVVWNLPGSIAGTARIKEPTMFALVVLRDLQPGRDSPVQVILTNSKGEFSFGGLPFGRYCIAAYSADEAASRWVPESGCERPVVILAAGESRRLELQR